MPQAMQCPQVEVEICVDGVGSARNAAAGGASRLELCAGLALGGLSPSLGTLVTIKALVKLPVFVLVRPRAGDFCYSCDEVDLMEKDVTLFREHGADGIVLGALTRDGDVDKDICQRLIAAAKPLPVTFHRAFDLAAKPLEALEDIVALGCCRLLTSGQASSVDQGLPLLQKLAEQCRGRITLMPGGGVREDNLAALLRATGVRAVHASASRPAVPAQGTRALSLGSASQDQSWLECSVDRVRQLVVIAAEFTPSQ
ncbi:copper homeostasis protein cutC homolog isoform X1 [Ixodes scapularis]|nr:copper homeostasis protein cutC homolog isoform X1 [Ixodes scapularis]